jgi:S1-C subfamily serine protease
MVPQSIPVPGIEKHDGTSWQIILFGIALLLVVGGIACVIIVSNNTPANNPSANEQMANQTVVSPELPLIPLGQSTSTEEIVALREKSIAFIRGQHSTGTGFSIAENIVATNRHVIDGEFLALTEVTFPSAQGLDKGPHEVKLLYADPKWDIAFLEVQTSLPHIPIAENHQFRRGQDIVVIGNPGGLENAVSVGVLSSHINIDGQGLHQLSISLNPGNSGGPVLDRNGEVIGMATMRSRRQEGIAFCIPSNELLNSLSAMQKLTEHEKAQQNSLHRARTAFLMLAIIHRISQSHMELYDAAMQEAVRRGLPANEGIRIFAKEVSERMLALDSLLKRAAWLTM